MKKNKPKALIWIIILMLSTFAFATDYYVSTTGNDNNNGTLSSPFRTISKAVSEASEGDTVYVREGTYSEAVRIRRRLTLKTYNNEHVLIECPINDENIDTTLTIDVDADGTIIDGFEITGGYYYGIMLFTKWDWGEADRSGATNITIKNCNIHHTGRDCIKITPECDNMTIENCEIHHSGTRYDGNAEGIDNVNSDNMVVRNCHIHDIATNGVYVKGGGTNAVIEKNIIENCGEGGVCIGFDTSPEYFDTNTNPDRYEAINSVVKNCLIVNTKYEGIGFYAAKNCGAYNNTLVNVAKNDHSAIYFGVALQDWEADSDPNDGIGYRPPSTNVEVKNNIVYQSSSISTPAVFIRTFYHEGDVGRVNGYDGMPKMDYNCYYFSGNTPTFTDRRPGHEIENATLSQWQLHINGENHSFVSDPKLDENYKPQSGSPCIDAGDSSVPVDEDIDSNPRSAPYDIGCYETNGSGGGDDNNDNNKVYYFGHIAHRNYTTYLIAYNTGSNKANFTVKLANTMGGIIEVHTYNVEAKSMLQIEVSANEDAKTGKIFLNSGKAIFKAVYFNTDGGMAEFILGNTLHKNLYFTFPSYNQNITWNGIAVFNGSDREVAVTVRAYKNGQEVAQQNFSIRSFAKLVDVIGMEDGIFPDLGLDGFDMVKVECSSESLCGLNISGDGQEKLVFTPAIAKE